MNINMHMSNKLSPLPLAACSLYEGWVRWMPGCSRPHSSSAQWTSVPPRSEEIFARFGYTVVRCVCRSHHAASAKGDDKGHRTAMGKQYQPLGTPRETNSIANRFVFPVLEVNAKTKQQRMATQPRKGPGADDYLDDLAEKYRIEEKSSAKKMPAVKKARGAASSSEKWVVVAHSRARAHSHRHTHGLSIDCKAGRHTHKCVLCNVTWCPDLCRLYVEEAAGMDDAAVGSVNSSAPAADVIKPASSPMGALASGTSGDRAGRMVR